MKGGRRGVAERRKMGRRQVCGIGNRKKASACEEEGFSYGEERGQDIRRANETSE